VFHKASLKPAKVYLDTAHHGCLIAEEEKWGESNHMYLYCDKQQSLLSRLLDTP